jgi:hypothetical protein
VDFDNSNPNPGFFSCPSVLAEDADWVSDACPKWDFHFFKSLECFVQNFVMPKSSLRSFKENVDMEVKG